MYLAFRHRSQRPCPPWRAEVSTTTMFAMGFTYIPEHLRNVTEPTVHGRRRLPQDWPYAPATPAARGINACNRRHQSTGAVRRYSRASPITHPNAAPTLSGWLLNTSTCVYPYYSTTANAGNAVAWNLIDGYLRVEYKDTSGNWNPVTMEWLNLGFARGLTPPTVSGNEPHQPQCDSAVSRAGRPQWRWSNRPERVSATLPGLECRTYALYGRLQLRSAAGSDFG